MSHFSPPSPPSLPKAPGIWIDPRIVPGEDAPPFQPPNFLPPQFPPPFSPPIAFPPSIRLPNQPRVLHRGGVAPENMMTIELQDAPRFGGSKELESSLESKYQVRRILKKR
mmetsp:Transcript_9906/g.24377  ORF Transcript_9906/g.24377 Transcript_9906/m.24377 type:complete len:111 (-) Transcript_9906:108-440(-)